jgi:hypothetical protein
MLFVPAAMAQFTRVNPAATREMVIAVADVNGDGLDDLITSDSIRRNIGGGMFGAATPVVARGEAILGKLDFNGDGAPDLLVQRPTIVANPEPPNVYGKPQIVLLQNNGNGGFIDRGLLPVEGGMPLVVDFDGDGKDDLIMMSSLGLTNRVRAGFYRSNWDGTFTLTDQKELSSYGRWSGPQSGTGVGLARGDLNRDGHVDLVLRSETEMVFLFGHGDGTFDQVNRFLPNAVGGEALDIADVDGDGKLDVVFAYATARINVMFGDDAGHFPRAATFDIPDQDSVRGGGSFALGKFTSAQPEIAVPTDNGNLLILSAAGGTIKITSRVPIALYRQNLYSGAFETPGKRDLLAAGFATPQGPISDWTSYEGHVFLAPAHPATLVRPLTPAPVRRTRAAGPRVTAEGFSVSIADDCVTYNDHWSLQREGFFYNDVSPSPGRLLEAALVDDAIQFRITPDGTRPNVPQVQGGAIVDTTAGTFGSAHGVDPCGKQAVYQVKATKD